MGTVTLPLAGVLRKMESARTASRAPSTPRKSANAPGTAPIWWRLLLEADGLGTREVAVCPRAKQSMSELFLSRLVPLVSTDSLPASQW